MKIILILFTLGGYYFIVESMITPQDKLITIPLYLFYVILGGWFSSLAFFRWVCDKRVENMRSIVIKKEMK